MSNLRPLKPRWHREKVTKTLFAGNGKTVDATWVVYTFTDADGDAVGEVVKTGTTLDNYAWEWRVYAAEPDVTDRSGYAGTLAEAKQAVEDRSEW